MKFNELYDKSISVYPGEYTPSPQKKALFESIKDHPYEYPDFPLVNVTETDEYLLLEVLLPGLHREDIFIEIKENIVTIIATDPTMFHKTHTEKKIHEFENKCLERHIALPANAATEFICAEYKEDVLRLYIPKSDYPSKNLPTQIVAY